MPSAGESIDRTTSQLTEEDEAILAATATPPEAPTPGSTETTSTTTTTTAERDAGTTADPERVAAVSGTVLQNLADPQIPTAAVQEAVQIDTAADQFVDPTATQFQAGTDTALQAATGTAVTQATPEEIEAQRITAAEAIAAGTSGVTQELPEEFLTSQRLTGLLEATGDDQIPDFARPAVAQAERLLAARGLSRSTIGRDQLVNTIIQSALPLAQADAVALQQNFAQNLSNKQQANILSTQNRQQAVLSNQGAENAARQFNASSQAQTDQFMSNMKASIEKQNADRLTSMEQFNSGQENAIAQFSTQISFARDQFNAQNATAIEQSNVQWRRQSNTINTAAQNSVNQANAMNAFNLSNQSLTFMWQEMRDAAKWTFESFQNEEQRRAALAQAALGNEAVTDEAKLGYIVDLGKFGLNLFAESGS
jgi:hypothetical protein